MTDVFVSYARSTAAQARAVAQALRADGYEVWIDDDLPAHRDFPTEIEQQLRAAKAVVVLWSSDAAKSRWVPAEADVAHSAGTLIQVSLDDTPPPLPFNRMQCIPMQGWNGDLAAPAWRKVAAGVDELVNGPARTKVKPPSEVSAHRASSAHANEPAERLLAVLAFDNISGDPEMTYFSDGVSEEIQQTVAQGSDLKVVARSSSFQFRGADKAVRKVASELHATHILDGSVRRSGGRVRISAQLVACQDEVTLWANRFDGDLSDVFALQEKIAGSVAEALKVAMGDQPQTAPLETAVYELFLRARSAISEGGRIFDATAASAAISLLERVVAAAPHHAASWELLAIARAWILRSGTREGSYEDGRNGVLKAAHTALQLDAKRGGAYEALAMLEPWGAYAARESLLKQALSLSPNEAGILTEMSTFCWSVGRFHDALRFAERACELNPLMPAARLNVANMRVYVGDYEAAVRMMREIYRRWPLNYQILFGLISVTSSLGFWDDFRAVVDDARHFEGWQMMQLRAMVYYAQTLQSGDPAASKDLVDAYVALFESTGIIPLNILQGISDLGYTDRAFELAERASFDHMFDPDGPLPSGNFPGTILGRWSAFNKTPRAVALFDRLGLCAYWVQSDQWPDCVEWAPFDLKAEVRRRVEASDLAAG